MKYSLLLVLGSLLWGCAQRQPQQQTPPGPPAPVPYTLQLDVVSAGYDSAGCWFHPRAGAIPGPTPTVVMTMQKWVYKSGTSDLFLPLNSLYTANLGKTWSEPVEQTVALGRRPEPGGVEVGISDFTPKWHQKSGKLLGIGHTIRYRDNNLVKQPSRQTAYAIYDPASRSWSAFATMAMPDEPKFHNAGAGSVQRVDLENGDILLPIYHKTETGTAFSSTVVRCTFDGQQLRYVEHGNELALATGRGFVEPSLTKFKNRYFLTLRNNDAGYVATSTDGLHFEEPRVWRFDDGTDLGNYNTQQHWVTHSGGLFLVYTRRGANNDHVFRHRAPLFMAQVDPERLVVIRATEQALVPNKGARLGNFGVVDVNERETWVTVAEGMWDGGAEYGADGRVYAARLKWEKPNRTWNKD